MTRLPLLSCGRFAASFSRATGLNPESCRPENRRTPRVFAAGLAVGVILDLPLHVAHSSSASRRRRVDLHPLLPATPDQEIGEYAVPPPVRVLKLCSEARLEVRVRILRQPLKLSFTRRSGVDRNLARVAGVEDKYLPRASRSWKKTSPSRCMG